MLSTSPSSNPSLLNLLTFSVNFPFPQEALDIVLIRKEDREQTFAMLAAVLWLGNISFQVIDNENHVEVIADEGKIYLLGILLDYFLIEVSYMMLIYDC